MSKPLVIIVEDNPLYLDFMRGVIDPLGVEVGVATNEKEGYEKITMAKKYPGPVIFLMDISLSEDETDKGGIRLTQRIKAEFPEEFNERVTVICTSNNDGPLVEEMAELKVEHFVSKFPRDIRNAVEDIYRG